MRGTRLDVVGREGTRVVIAVAVSLLPALGMLLYAMDRLEDRLSAGSSTPRHARRRHLRLVRGTATSRAERGPAERSGTGPSPAERSGVERGSAERSRAERGPVERSARRLDVA
jgi:hypothetical protein